MQRLIKTAACAALLLAGAATTALAQRTGSPFRNPVKESATAKEQLFRLPERDSNFFFRADLPGDAFLMIRFQRLRYWQPGTLPEMAGVANAVWRRVADSFTSPTASRRLSIHLPPSGYPALAALREWGTGERTLVVRGNRAQPVRLATDTITILKTGTAPDGDTARAPQLEYSFLLRDMADIESLAADTALLAQLSQTLDSVVAATADRWKKNPDARYHGMEVHYDLHEGTGGNTALRVERRGNPLQYLENTVEVGTSLLSSTLAANSSIKLLYHLGGARGRRSAFVGASYSGLAFSSVDAGELNIRTVSFVNLEGGAELAGLSSPFPVYRAAIGLGYRVGSQNKGPYDLKYRVYISYAVSRTVTLTTEFYGMPKRDGEDQRRVLTGLGISLRIL